jgi:hypothetical protein
MSVVIDGATGVTAAAFDGAVDAANLTGTLPALNGAALTNLSAGNLTGALPALDGSALTNLPAPTSEQVGTATAGLAAGSVGSYALLNSLSVATRNSGATVAGSNLRFANTYAEGSTVGYSTQTPSGTWRLMGNTGNYNATLTSTSNVQASLWLRIS